MLLITGVIYTCEFYVKGYIQRRNVFSTKLQ